MFILTIIILADYTVGKLYTRYLAKTEYRFALRLRYIYQFLSLFNFLNYFTKQQRIICIFFECYTLNVISKSILSRFLRIINLFSGNKKEKFRYIYIKSIASLFNSGRYVMAKEDEYYADMVRDKSIAIVCPGYSLMEDGQEIDGFDIVIRISYGFGGVYDEAIYGKKTNCAFYANYRLDTSGEQFFVDVAKNCFIIMKNNNSQFQKDLIICNKARLAKYYTVFSPGFENQMPIILHDLLHFAPKKIKVFKADLYTGERLYNDINNHDDLRLNIALHDCFSHLLLLKYFTKIPNSIIEFDIPLTCLVNGSLSQYADKLEKTFKTK